jgi:hypothetical protein
MLPRLVTASGEFATGMICQVNVVVKALEFMDPTVLYEESSSARSLQWRSGQKNALVMTLVLP